MDLTRREIYLLSKNQCPLRGPRVARGRSRNGNTVFVQSQILPKFPEISGNVNPDLRAQIVFFLRRYNRLVGYKAYSDSTWVRSVTTYTENLFLAPAKKREQ